MFQRMVNSLPEKQHLVILQSIIMPMTDYSRHQAKTMEAMRAAGDTPYVIGEIKDGEKGVTLC